MIKIINKIFKTPKKNIIAPYQNGPLNITGKLELIDANGNLLEKTKELFLCRCGNSNNKPYCDGQHKKYNYRDNGEFKHPPPSEDNLINKGTLEIKLQANGPLSFRGVVCIQDSAQQVNITRKVGTLCRCGHSSNSPFCDGTHSKIEFIAD